MSRYFDYFNDDIMHYGVKGMKWRNRKATSTTYPNRPRARQRRIAGESKGILRFDEKIGVIDTGGPQRPKKYRTSAGNQANRDLALQLMREGYTNKLLGKKNAKKNRNKGKIKREIR